MVAELPRSGPRSCVHGWDRRGLHISPSVPGLRPRFISFSGVVCVRFIVVPFNLFYPYGVLLN